MDRRRPAGKMERRLLARCVLRPQRGHKNLGGGNAPDKAVPPKNNAPQGHKNPTLMPLRGVVYSVTHHGGVAPA